MHAKSFSEVTHQSYAASVDQSPSNSFQEGLRHIWTEGMSVCWTRKKAVSQFKLWINSLKSYICLLVFGESNLK